MKLAAIMQKLNKPASAVRRSSSLPAPTAALLSCAQIEGTNTSALRPRNCAKRLAINLPCSGQQRAERYSGLTNVAGGSSGATFSSAKSSGNSPAGIHCSLPRLADFVLANEPAFPLPLAQFVEIDRSVFLAQHPHDPGIVLIFFERIHGIGRSALARSASPPDNPVNPVRIL